MYQNPPQPATEKLDREKMLAPLHIAVPGGDGYMILTRELYARMVKRIYDLQRKAENLPTDDEIIELLIGDRGTIH